MKEGFFMKHPLKKWLIGSTAALLIAGTGGTVYHYQSVKAEETALTQQIEDTLTTYKNKVTQLYATSAKDALKKDVTHDTANKLVKTIAKLDRTAYNQEEKSNYQSIEKDAKEALVMIEVRDAVIDYIKTPTDKKLKSLNKQMKSLETTKKTFVADQQKQIKEAQNKVKQAQEKKKAEQEQKKQAELAQKQAEAQSQAVVAEQQEETQQAVEATNQAQEVPEANQEQATNTQGNTSSNTNTATNNAPSNNQGNTQNNAASNTNQGNTATNNAPSSNSNNASSSSNKPSSNNGSSNNDHWEGEVEWTEGGNIDFGQGGDEGWNTWTGGEFNPGDIDW